MGDKNVCSSVLGVYSNKLGAWECAKQTERENKIPMSVMEIEERGETQFLVHEILDCRENAVFDDYIGQNEHYAKTCAEGLTRITGQNNITQRIQERFLFADVWRVSYGELEDECRIGAKFESLADAQACLGQLEKAGTVKPGGYVTDAPKRDFKHFVLALAALATYTFFDRTSKYYEYFTDYIPMPTPDPDKCKEGAIYDHDYGAVMRASAAAHLCAESLTRITGTDFESKFIGISRWWDIFPDPRKYQVVKKVVP